MMFAIVPVISNVVRRWSQLLWAFTKSSVVNRVKGGKADKAEYFIQWQNYCLSENTWEPAEHLPEDLIAAFENRSVDPLCLMNGRETSSSNREGFKIIPGLQRNYQDAAWCIIASDISWLAVRPAQELIPRQRRGADDSRAWFFPKEVFNSDRWRMSHQHSSPLEALSWQVTYLLRWARLQNCCPPSGESSDQVVQELFRRTHAVSQMLHTE